jgi:hypothetical protein
MNTTHYFVDEAGDTTLFGRHGKVLIGTDAVSRYFIVGRLEVLDLPALTADLQALRADLLADPLLNSVPSMRQAAGKTALFFHAKDDVPEVRHAVIRLLLRHQLKFSAVVKDKRALLEHVQQRNNIDQGYRYRADGHELYDELSARLFGLSGQVGTSREVTFAVRGSKPRTAALKAVLDRIDSDFHTDFGFAPHGHTAVHSGLPSQCAGLQSCDYMLWALQRFYERGEERYLAPMWRHFERVLDLGMPGERGNQSASVLREVEFNEKHPLSLASRAGDGNKGSGDIG